MTGCAGCSRCGETRKGALYGHVAQDRYICSDCWKRMGRPFPSNPPSLDELQESMNAARDAMTRRGGADRYRVRAGKT